MSCLRPLPMTKPTPRPAHPIPPARLAVRYRFGFLTLPNYSMIALTSAVEPLRMANRVCRHEVYEWTLASLDGAPAAASNGMSLVAHDRARPAWARSTSSSSAAAWTSSRR